MPGTERFLTVHRFGTQGARPKAYLQAALHADEWPGLMALQHLIPLLIAADEKGEITGEIVVLPFANPIGLTQRVGGAVPGRFAFDGTGNFNRNWPDLTEAAATQMDGPLTGDMSADVAMVRRALVAAVDELDRRTDTDEWRAILMGLAVDADVVLDIHCDQESLPHIYCHESHESEGRTLAAACNVPVLMLEQEAGGFSFDDALASVWRRLAARLDGGSALPMANFACTLEFRGKDDVSDEFGTQDAAGIMHYLAAAGLVSGVEPAKASDGPTPYKLEEVLSLIHISEPTRPY